MSAAACRTQYWWIGGALALLCSVLLALSVGSSGWGWSDTAIVWQIRLPRLLAALGTGAALALAGALVQLLSRNPLSDPHVLGVSSGASVGALLALLALGSGLHSWGAELLALSGALLGALVSAALVLTLAWGGMSNGLAQRGVDAGNRFLLVGVMVAAACGAMVSFLLAVADEGQLRNLVFWLLGDLNGVSVWWPVWLGLGVAALLAWPVAQALDLMSRGEAWAWSLGVPVLRCRRQAVLAACVAVGAAVATAGNVGFVGLVAPHCVRFLGVHAARQLLPLSALFGGVFLLLADTFARSAFAPRQLPVGVVCAAVGVPLFLFLLLRRPAQKP